MLRYLFEHQLANFDFVSKLQTAVYPSNMARIGMKLWEIDVSTPKTKKLDVFFGAAKKKNDIKTQVARFGGAMINHRLSFVYFLSTILGGG